MTKTSSFVSDNKEKLLKLADRIEEANMNTYYLTDKGLKKRRWWHKGDLSNIWVTAKSKKEAREILSRDDIKKSPN